MSDRKKLSGAHYRKEAKERQTKEEDVVKKIRKLNTYFQKTNITANKNFTEIESSIQDEIGANLPKAVNDDSINSSFSLESAPNVEKTLTPTDPDPVNIQQNQILGASDGEQLIHSVPSVIMSNDPAEWIINDSTIETLLSKEINQNINGDLLETKTFDKSGCHFRTLSHGVFKRKLQNGEEQDRKYSIYSPNKKSVFCIPCRLFGGGGSLLGTEGCNDWKNIHQIVSSHENSRDHHTCQKAMLDRSRAISRIDYGLLSQTNAELLAEFDPFMANHIATCGNPGSGNTSYLSSTICDEFINLMAKHVTDTIVDEVKKCKYFSIIVDSTPDLSHVDQLSFVLRYVKDGTPVERFLQFLTKVGHKSQSLENAVLSFLDNLGIDIKNCRGQTYDNASNMSGAYTGLQAQLIKLNALATYIPCSAHSLNLVGLFAAECVPEASAFFSTIQNIFTFFTASTHRWEIFSNCLKKGQKVLKRASGTRWSSKHDARESLSEYWAEVKESLTEIQNDDMEKPLTRNEAKGYVEQLDCFEFVFMITFWSTILERFHKTSKMLQSVTTDLETVVQFYRSLTEFITRLRTEKMFEEFVCTAKKFVHEEYKSDKKRTLTRKLLPGESRANEVTLNGKNNWRVNVYFAVLDKFRSELEKRQVAYTTVAGRFDFLFHLENFESEDILLKSKSLQKLFSNNLDENFPMEVIHFKEHGIHNFKQFWDDQLYLTFPNISIAFRIFFSMAVSNCSAERSFSALKRIKNYLRITLTEEKLNALSILSIENRLLEVLKL